MSEEIRRLVVMRHAKYEVLSGDLDQLGVEQCTRVRTFFRNHAYRPEGVIYSTAPKTKQTFEAVFSDTGEIECSAVDESILMVQLPILISKIPDTYHSVLIVGHGPAIESLVKHSLTKTGKFGSFQLNNNFRHGALCEMAFRGNWLDFNPGTAKLTGGFIPTNPSKPIDNFGDLIDLPDLSGPVVSSAISRRRVFGAIALAIGGAAAAHRALSSNTP